MPNLDLEPAAAVESRLASSREIATPAFVYDEAGIDRLVDTLEPVRRATGCKVLFSLKAFSFIDAVEQMAPRLDGFAASSLFEARLAREVCGRGAEVHLTSPGIRPGEVDDLGSLCDYVSFNSMSHLRVYGGRMAPYTSLGLRVNPQLSFVPDDRYDPCRPHSKLGVPLERLTATVAADRGQIAGVEGVHVHSNCDSTDLSQLLRTVRHLDENLGPLLHGLRWINLGGGYLFDEAGDIGPVIEAVAALESTYGLQVYLEPGAALVRSAGFVVASVLDVFPSEGVQVAVLDTTVNHMPEVLEYGFEPDVCGHDEEGEVEYLLAGSTCLAGGRVRRLPVRRAAGDRGEGLIRQRRGLHAVQGAHLQRRQPPVGLRARHFGRPDVEEEVRVRRLRGEMEGWQPCIWLSGSWRSRRRTLAVGFSTILRGPS